MQAYLGWGEKATVQLEESKGNLISYSDVEDQRGLQRTSTTALLHALHAKPLSTQTVSRVLDLT